MSYLLFPFDKVPKNGRIILYGSGNVGKQFYDQVAETNFCKIVLWLDKNADGIFTKKPEVILNLNADDYDIVVIAIESEFVANDVKIFLMGYGVPENKILHKVQKNEQINFFTFAKLSECIRKNLYKLPSDIDLIVGVPRSGIIPAYMLALFLNKNVCTLIEFINNLAIDKGERPVSESAKDGRKKVLIVDDSIFSGNALAKTKRKLENINGDYEIIFLSVIALEESKKLVDYYFQIVSLPRLFQWNYMNHSFLEKSCIDIDGVLCVDPTPDENDDGEKYVEFCLNAKPLYIPSYEIHTLVTSRLEKYRPQTEEWLRKHNVKYKNLYMLDLPNAESRRNLNIHGSFKSEIYSKLEDTILFIESEPHQAKKIAELTGKPCICVSTDEYFRGQDPVKYEKTPLNLFYVEMSITTRCTLKCKDCGLFNANYYTNGDKRPENFNTKMLISDMKNFLDAIDEIFTFRLIGGEPFLHPDWDELMKVLYESNKVQIAEIITNGTYIPNEEKLNVLKHPKANVIISNYGKLSTKLNEMETLLKQKKIKYTIANCDDDGWWDPGDNRDRKRSSEKLLHIFNSCHLAKKCKHILNGKLFVCSRDAHAQNLGIFPEDTSSYTNLRNTDYLRERIREIYYCTMISNCNYCDGTNNKNPRLKAAVQISPRI